MTVAEKLGAFGDWTVTLSAETPTEILEALKDHLLGTLYITPSRIDPELVHPREVARYAGIYRKREFTDDRRTISGNSLLWLLGNSQGTGAGVDETPIDLTGQSFEDALTAALADTDIQVGNIIPEIGGLPSGVFYLQDARYKVEEITRQFAAEYRITPKAQLDAGTPASLYPTFNDPVVFIKRGAKGVDPDWKPLPIASSAMGEDLINWANHKLIVAEQDGAPIIQGQATISSSKRGPNGTLLEITSVSADSAVGQAAADSRAAALLALENAPRKTVSLSTDEFDVDGTVAVGDTVTVWNPEVGFYDETNHIKVRGEHYFPLNLRVFGSAWPITKDMGLYLQEPSTAATIYDLSPWFVPESGSTDLEVGAAAKKLIPTGGESLGPIVGPVVNPGAPPGIPDPPSVFGDERTLFVVVPTTSAGLPQPLNVTTMRVYASTTSGFTAGPTNYIGAIPVSRANILLGQTVKGAFEWFIDDLTYVRVTGVNSVEGPASIEVSDAATLIPSAAILSLVADKIDAGTISASVTIMSPEIYGGIIATATGVGQRVALEEGDFDRIKFYSGIVTEIEPSYINTSAADGNLGIHATEFSDSGGDNGNINIVPKGGPSAFPFSRILVAAEEVSLGQFGSPSSMVLGVDVDLVTTGDYSLTANHGSMTVDATSLDLTHDLGGQVNMDSDMLFMKSPDEFWISGVISDISILGRAAKVEIMNDDATAYRGIKADGFEHANPPTIAGDGAGNAGLYNLLNALDAMGLIVNTVT